MLHFEIVKFPCDSKKTKWIHNVPRIFIWSHYKTPVWKWDQRKKWNENAFTNNWILMVSSYFFYNYLWIHLYASFFHLFGINWCNNKHWKAFNDLCRFRHNSNLYWVEKNVIEFCHQNARIKKLYCILFVKGGSNILLIQEAGGRSVWWMTPLNFCYKAT